MIHLLKTRGKNSFLEIAPDHLSSQNYFKSLVIWLQFPQFRAILTYLPNLCLFSTFLLHLRRSIQSPQKPITRMCNFNSAIFVSRLEICLSWGVFLNRPGVARAVLQSPKLKLWENVDPTICVICYVSCVTFHLSHVTCQMSRVTCHLSPVICHLSHVKKNSEIFFI